MLMEVSHDCGKVRLKLPTAEADLDVVPATLDEPDWLDLFWRCLDCRVHSLTDAVSDSRDIDAGKGFAEALARMDCKALIIYKALLEASGYLLSSDGSAYATWNARTFSYNYSVDSEIPAVPKTAQDQKGDLLPDNILGAAPALSGLTSDFSLAKTLSINAIILKTLSERGPDELRQFQTVLEYEECDCLEDALEIATHLDCYGFIDILSFCEAAKAEIFQKARTSRRCAASTMRPTRRLLMALGSSMSRRISGCGSAKQIRPSSCRNGRSGTGWQVRRCKKQTPGRRLLYRNSNSLPGGISSASAISRSATTLGSVFAVSTCWM